MFITRRNCVTSLNVCVFMLRISIQTLQYSFYVILYAHAHVHVNIHILHARMYICDGMMAESVHSISFSTENIQNLLI